MGVRALFPDRNDSLGFGPRRQEVTWAARGFKKMLESKYFVVAGGSCWMFLYGKGSAWIYDR